MGSYLTSASSVSQVKEENAALASHLTEVQSQKQELQAQLARLQDEWSAANSNNLRLMEEVSTKHNSLQVQTTLSSLSKATHRRRNLSLPDLLRPSAFDHSTAAVPATNTCCMLSFVSFSLPQWDPHL